MPIIKSAKKRVKVAAKANARNSLLRRRVRSALKAYAKALEAGKAADISKTQLELISALDRAAKKNVIHPNKTARLKARVSAQAKKAGVKPQKTAKTPATKPAAKKTVKKAPAKKTAK